MLVKYANGENKLMICIVLNDNTNNKINDRFLIDILQKMIMYG